MSAALVRPALEWNCAPSTCWRPMKTSIKTYISPHRPLSSQDLYIATAGRSPHRSKRAHRRPGRHTPLCDTNQIKSVHPVLHPTSLLKNLPHYHPRHCFRPLPLHLMRPLTSVCSHTVPAPYRTPPQQLCSTCPHPRLPTPIPPLPPQHAHTPPVGPQLARNNSNTTLQPRCWPGVTLA